MNYQPSLTRPPIIRGPRKPRCTCHQGKRCAYCLLREGKL